MQTRKRTRRRDGDEDLRENSSLSEYERYQGKLTERVADDKDREGHQFIIPGWITPDKMADTFEERLDAALTWALILKITPSQVRKRAKTLKRLEEIIFREWCHRGQPAYDFTWGELTYGSDKPADFEGEFVRWYFPVENDDRPLEILSRAKPFGCHDPAVRLPREKMAAEKAANRQTERQPVQLFPNSGQPHTDGEPPPSSIEGKGDSK